jgi:UDP-glucose 4-epimerase
MLNLGSESGISVKEMVDMARTITNLPIPVIITGRRAGDPSKLVASSAKANMVLGWKTRFSDVKTLVESTWNMYKKYRQ